FKFWKKIGKKEEGERIRTRIAPSPTGPLHIGTARSALFNYLFAKQNKGDFILRIEDTDLERSDPRFEKDIIEGLLWLNIIWDEGPYHQSERKEIYKKNIEMLLEEGKAFYCPHSKEELAREKEEQIKRKEAPRHECEYKIKKQKSKKGIIRLATPKKIVEFTDLIRGKIKFDTSLLGDIAIAKDKQTPLYNFAVVIDDFEMKISHVIRGEDHISNTPKQILIQEALGIRKQPYYAHLPLVLGVDRSKLSKRHAPVSISEYRKSGYLPEAIVNFIALLGWNPGTDQEIFSLEELVKKFDLRRVQKGGAVFNIQRLNWLNGIYIRKKTPQELTDLLLKEGFLRPADSFPKSYLEKVVALEQSRLVKLSEVEELTEYFFKKPVYPKTLLQWKSNQSFEEIKVHLDKILNLIFDIAEGDFKKEKIKASIWSYAEEKGRGDVLWPMRVALTGKDKSPDPFEIAEVLGKEETVKRLEAAKILVS
ncbi:MAG: glutamate--tRNA ligase, partial [Minisyncoccales bacterium]